MDPTKEETKKNEENAETTENTKGTDGFDEVLDKGFNDAEDDKLAVLDTNEKTGVTNEISKDVDLNYLSGKTWEQLQIRDDIYKNLLNMGFASPSKIQASTFDMIVKPPYKHLIAQAPNGCGKTGAFSIPAIHKVTGDENTLQVIIFAHNRIMVIQIAEIIQKMCADTNIKASALLDNNKSSMTNIGHIAVTTPGNFEKVLKKKLLTNINTIKMLVLDEADHMIDNDVCVNAFKTFCDALVTNKVDCQFVFFSATYEDKHFNFINKYVKKAQCVKIDREALTLKKVSQMFYQCQTTDEKITFIENYLKVSSSGERCLIFVNTKDYVKKLNAALQAKGYKTYVLMGGDMDRGNRELTVKKFKNGDIQILITTDIISRGFDEKLVKLVVNFDIPKNYDIKGEPAYDTYLHRIGRTGRFGTSGIGLNLVRKDDKVDELKLLTKIQDFYKSSITEIKSVDDLMVEFKKVLEDKF